MISFLYVVIKAIKNNPMADQKYLSDTRQEVRAPVVAFHSVQIYNDTEIFIRILINK